MSGIIISRQKLDILPPFYHKIMGSDIVRCLIKESAQTCEYNLDDVYTRLCDLNQNLGGLLAVEERKNYYEIFVLSKYGVLNYTTLVAEPFDCDYRRFFVYHAVKDKYNNVLLESLEEVTFQKAHEFLDEHFDKTTLKIKEQYR